MLFFSFSFSPQNLIMSERIENTSTGDQKVSALTNHNAFLGSANHGLVGQCMVGGASRTSKTMSSGRLLAVTCSI